MDIKEGDIIGNKELVELFGSEINKDRYEKTGKVNSSMKQSLLYRAMQFYDIEDIGRANYKINKIYSIIKPIQYIKAKNTIHEYLMPIILKKLIATYHIDNKLEMPVIEYAIFMNIINSTYRTARYGIKDLCQRECIDKKTAEEFFELTTKSLRELIENSLDKLKSAGTLEWFTYPVVVFKTIDTELTQEEDIIGAKYYRRRANAEEIRFWIDCKQKTMKLLGIEKENECYFGYKAKLYQDEIDRLFKDRNIKFFYYNYEIYYTSIDKCETFLHHFEDLSLDELSINFNEFFINNTINNAKIRSSKDVSKIKYLFRKNNNYLLDYENLCNITLNISSEIKEFDRDFEIKIEKKKNGYNLYVKD